MTSSPPRLASWTLAQLLPAAECEVVLGDLWEEFHHYVVPAQGIRRARWWYWRQVLTSAVPLVARSLETSSAWNVVAASLVMLLSIAPAWILAAVRSFALSQVPLKTEAEPSTLFLVALTLCTAGGLVAGARFTLRILNLGGSVQAR